VKFNNLPCNKTVRIKEKERQKDMPDRDVKTVRDLIYYQYAKIIASRAFGAADGKKEKNNNFKTKDILSRPRLISEGITKRAGDADGNGELTVLDFDHIIA
jgi:hypothetical protein